MIGNEEIVISGIAGRFPESANLEEFWNNLYNGVDMVTDIQDRWDVNSFPISRRMGQLKDLDKFDASFMGIHGKQVEHMDPRLRFILELTHETLVDAGINPVTIRGSKTATWDILSLPQDYAKLRKQYLRISTG
ncbi:unnamed protein product [Allacma fusca]|uniref:Ketosynthase family 3 (KS3) domain-containing protein n=1 Tax=Allacma fusca TaxID=39272 RepID=A0A8J2PF76_9HEXA|nr:unnamed protein product [Allacma fusca]